MMCDISVQPVEPRDGFSWIETPAGAALVCAPLRAAVDHLFTTRAWALGSAADGDDRDGWRQLADAFGVDPARVTRVRQVHGDAAVVRRAGGAPAPDREAADIILSDDPSLVLAVQTADCVPLLLADRRTGAAAAAHAGWRGLAARVPQRAVEEMRSALGAAPADLVVAIGPAIGGPRYEVGGDVYARFASAGIAADRLDAWFTAGRPDHWHLDVVRAARDQLAAAGVPPGQIHAAGLCTASSPQLCSYRRDGARAGRMAAAVRPRPR
jgi:purine-nucleoside/S-methyl-5'-thioadenosine phosphorylase / adenosine deaminase